MHTMDPAQFDPQFWVDTNTLAEVLQQPATLAKTSVTYGPIRSATWVTPDQTTVEVKVARGLAAKALRLASGMGQEVAPGVWLVAEGRVRWYPPNGGWGQASVFGPQDPVRRSTLAADIAAARRA